MKKIVIAYLVLGILFTTNTKAQLGGLLKKVKDKVAEKKSTPSNTSSESKNQAADNEQTNSNATEVIKNTEGKKNDANTPDDYFLVNNPLGKISFSNQPFTATATSKTKFTSSEFIYGRLQLNSGTIKDVLKIKEKSKKNPFYNFEYVVVVYRNKKEKYDNEQVWNSCLLTDANLDKNYLDFDILPDPEKSTTIISALSDFSAGKSTVPLYGAIKPTVFSEDGVYKIDVIIRNPTVDGWGNLLPKEKWPTFEADFDFEFSSSDIEKLTKNDKLASDKASTYIEDVITNAITPLPKQWNEKSSALAMGFTQAQLMNIYENSFSSKFEPYTVVKLHASPSSGGWTVQTNEYGIPRYRYSNQWYTVFIKFKNGKGACFFQGFGLRQNYEGGGTYGKVFCDKNDTFHYADCANMK